MRQWWQDRCIEWCFNRVEDGKFGDQKYLDDWPTRFGDSVHVLAQLDLLLAPWNARRFPYSRAVAWHFHGLRLLERERVLLHMPYKVPNVVYRMVYLVYLQELRRSLTRIGRSVVQKKGHRSFLSWARAMAGNLLRSLRTIQDFNAVRRLPL